MREVEEVFEQLQGLGIYDPELRIRRRAGKWIVEVVLSGAVSGAYLRRESKISIADAWMQVQTEVDHRSMDS